MKIVIDWQLSSFFGWGVYGTNLALEWANMDVEGMTSHVGRRDNIAIDPLRKAAIRPFIDRSEQYPLVDKSKAAFIAGLGNGALTENTKAKTGVIFFEFPETVAPAAIERLKRFDQIITGSKWNTEVLKSAGLPSVTTLIQGVDHSIFHPAPKRGLFPGKFLIFSGGKAEPRKGQDLVVKAFRVFAKDHPDAMLVTAWDSPWMSLRNGMDLDLSSVADRVINIGQTPNGAMAPIYRECDVALFPNRCEGGTNLVAMECISCGVPTIVSGNTGHQDLLDYSLNVFPLSCQGKCDGYWSEWGESNVDQIVAYLERFYQSGGSCFTPIVEKLPGWDVAACGLAAAVSH